MKLFFNLLISTVLVGDCIQLVNGVFKGEYWQILAVNNNHTVDIKQNKFIIRQVRNSYIKPVDKKYCK